MSASAAAWERVSHVFKTVDGRPLELDAIGSNPSLRKPCLMWLHGGGLIFGSRTVSPRPAFTQALVERGFVVACVDYRLAPETPLEAIAGDVADAWQWLCGPGAEAVGADPQRMAVAGASAGAYLALLGGCRWAPRPRAVASLWGFGDITAPWEAEPSAHYRGFPLVDAADARSALGLSPVPDAEGRDRSLFYLYTRQQGCWLQEVTRHTPAQDRAWFDPWCPLRGIGPGYPPTVLVHGRDDVDVPASESDALATRLREFGVPHTYHALPGVGHGFAGASADLVRDTEAAVADFLLEQLSAASPLPQ